MGSKKGKFGEIVTSHKQFSKSDRDKENALRNASDKKQALRDFKTKKAKTFNADDAMKKLDKYAKVERDKRVAKEAANKPKEKKEKSWLDKMKDKGKAREDEMRKKLSGRKYADGGVVEAKKEALRKKSGKETSCNKSYKGLMDMLKK